MAVEEQAPSAAGWAQLQPILDEAMAGLKDGDRDVLLLRFFEGQAFAEIGRRLGVTEDAARMRVDRALARLRVRLDRCSVVPAMAVLADALSLHAAGSAPSGLAATVSAAALNGAATGGGWAAAVVTGILMTKVQIAISTVILAVLAGSVAWMTRENNVLAAQIDAARERGASLRASIAETNRRIAQEEFLQPSAGSSPQSEDKEAVRKHWLIARKSLDAGYASLFRRLRLPSGKLERLKDLLADRECDATRARDFARSQGVTIAREEEFSIRQFAAEGKDSHIRDLLGGLDYQRFTAYDRTIDVRTALSSLDKELKALGEPLSDAQMDALVGLIDGRSSGKGWRTQQDGVEITEEVIQSANACLSPLQVCRLKAAQAQLMAMRRLAELQREGVMREDVDDLRTLQGRFGGKG